MVCRPVKSTSTPTDPPALASGPADTPPMVAECCQDVSLGMHQLSCRIRRSGRARHIRLTVDGERGLCLVLPMGVDLGDGLAFLRAKQAWVLAKLATVDAHREARAARLAVPEHVALAGEPFPVEVAIRPVPTVTVEKRTDHFRVLSPSPDQVRWGLKNWLWRRAKLVIPRRVSELVKSPGGEEFRRLQVRDQKTLWGSCSVAGTLSFNWRLLMVPPAVCDYVILHELSHLVHPHHQASFWGHLAARCDHLAGSRAWLESHGRALLEEW